MKTLTFLIVLMSVNSALAEYVCYGREGKCQASRDLTCGIVTKLDDSTYRLSHLQHITGCIAWGVSKFKSKNKICKNMLKSYGETSKVRFLHGSDVRGEMETAFGIESTSQIDCEIRGVK